MNPRQVLIGLALAALAAIATLLWYAAPRAQEGAIAAAEPGEPALAGLTTSRPQTSGSESPGLALVREESRPTTRRRIDGRVVDADGSALPGVRVVLVAELAESRGSRTRRLPLASVTTDPAGRFELFENPQRSGERLRLAVNDLPGYESFVSTEVAFGAHDLVLVLRTGRVLEVRTVDEITGEIVDPCNASVGIAVPEQRTLSPGSPELPWSQGKPVAIVGRPRPGTLLLAPVPATEILLITVPKDERHARITQRVVVTQEPRQTVIVRLPVERHRVLRVLGHDLRPRANVAFQLVRSEVPAWYPGTPGIVDAEFTGAGHVSRVRTQGGFTNAAGETVLFGARGLRYELVLDAPGQASQLVRDVFVDDALAPLVITLEFGAEIHGTLGPKEALARMARPEPSKDPRGTHPPAFWLTPLGSTTPLPGQIPLAEDGSFRCGGLQAGSYVLRMYWYDAGGKAHHEQFPEIRDLRAGERRALELRLP